MDPVARILLVSLLVGALLKVKSLFLTLWQIYFLQCGSPFDIRTLGFMLLMVCNTLKLFRLSRKPAPSVNGGTWGFLSSFCVFFCHSVGFSSTLLRAFNIEVVQISHRIYFLLLVLRSVSADA